MKNTLILLVLALFLWSCEEDFTKDKYDVLFTFTNTTNEIVNLSVAEINGRINWEKSLMPIETFEIKFNIKEDIKAEEGGFIIKAIFANGKSLEENTGYYTNYQLAPKNPQFYNITTDSIKITNL